MSAIPDASKIKKILLEHMSLDELKAEIKRVEEAIPFLKGNMKMLYVRIAKENKLYDKLNISLKKSGYDDKEIQPNGEYTKVGDFKESPYKVINVNAWILHVSDVSKTRSDNDKVSFVIADETGIDSCWIFGENAEAFAKNSFQYSAGKPIHLEKVAIKDNKNKKFVRFYWDNTTFLPYNPDQHGELCSYKNIAITNVEDMEDKHVYAVQGMVIEQPTEIIRHGCDVGHKIEANVGSSVYCKKCGTTKTVEEIKEGKFGIIDNTAGVTVKVNKWQWENFPRELDETTPFIFIGDYNEQFGNLSLKFYFESSVEMSNGSTGVSVLTKENLPKKIWEYVYKEQKSDRPLDDLDLIQEWVEAGNSLDFFEKTVNELIENQVISKVNDQYVTYWDTWEEAIDIDSNNSSEKADISSLFVPKDKFTTEDDCMSCGKTTQVNGSTVQCYQCFQKELIRYFIPENDESSLDEPTDEIVTASFKQYESVKSLWGEVPYERLLNALSKKAGGNKYQTRKILEKIVDNDAGEFILKNDKLYLAPK